MAENVSIMTCRLTGFQAPEYEQGQSAIRDSMFRNQMFRWAYCALGYKDED